MEDLIAVVSQWGADFLNMEVAKMTLAFMIAARLHRRWVRKDVTEQMTSITGAINNLAQTLTRSLELHSKRIDVLTVRVDNLDSEFRGIVK